MVARLSLRIPKKHKEILEQTAKSYGITITQLIRMWIWDEWQSKKLGEPKNVS